MKIILAFVVALVASSCSIRITPDGGKEVAFDGVQAVQFVKQVRDAKNARNVQP